jgi:hypothetical protein
LSGDLIAQTYANSGEARILLSLTKGYIIPSRRSNPKPGFSHVLLIGKLIMTNSYVRNNLITGSSSRPIVRPRKKRFFAIVNLPKSRVSNTWKIWEVCDGYEISKILCSANSRLTSSEQWHVQLSQNKIAGLLWHPCIEQLLSTVGTRTRPKYRVSGKCGASEQRIILRYYRCHALKEQI